MKRYRNGNELFDLCAVQNKTFIEESDHNKDINDRLDRIDGEICNRLGGVLINTVAMETIEEIINKERPKEGSN